MNNLYSSVFLTALLLATGQSLWKKAAASFSIYQKGDIPLIAAAFKVLFSSYFIIGGALYVVATLLYLWLFSRYAFYSVQITLVSLVMILSLFISHFVFKEHISALNLLGVPIILTGVALLTCRS